MIFHIYISRPPTGGRMLPRSVTGPPGSSESTDCKKTADGAEENRHNLVIHHIDRSHTAGSFKLMNSMRYSGDLCDIHLHVNDQVFPAHKVVLASCSAYFHAMFTSDMIERDSHSVTLHEVDPYALQLLLEFAYTAEVVVNEQTVQVLLPAASLLQMGSVREVCCKYLVKQLDPTNCLGIRSFADSHSCQELLRHSHQYTLKNFFEVCCTDEFLVLKCNEVIDLINSDDLCNVSEENIFNSAIRWIKHDMENRQQYVAQILSCIKLPLLPREFLMTHVESEPFIRNHPECKELLLQAMKYHLLPEQRYTLQIEQSQPRKCTCAVSGLFAVGGGSLFAIHSDCEYYSPVTDTWKKAAAMTTRRARAGIASVCNRIYAVGGYDGASDLSTAEYYCPLVSKWVKTNMMGTRRSGLGVCEWKGLLYAAGGFDGSSCLNTVERYDPLTDTWSAVAPMSFRRRHFKLAALDDFIYAIGGYDGCSHLPSVEKYDPRLNKWSGVTYMISRRSNASVAVLDGAIYVCGGSDGSTVLSSSERYNARRDLWESAASMHTRRSTHDAVLMDGYLYVVGGNDGSTSLNSVERYDPKTNRWMLVSTMNLRRSSVGAAMLETCHIGHKIKGNIEEPWEELVGINVLNGNHVT